MLDYEIEQNVVTKLLEIYFVIIVIFINSNSIDNCLRRTVTDHHIKPTGCLLFEVLVRTENYVR